MYPVVRRVLHTYGVEEHSRNQFGLCQTMSFLYLLHFAAVIKWTLCAALLCLVLFAFLECHCSGCLSRGAGTVVVGYSSDLALFQIFFFFPLWGFFYCPAQEVVMHGGEELRSHPGRNAVCTVAGLGKNTSTILFLFFHITWSFQKFVWMCFPLISEKSGLGFVLIVWVMF